MRFICAFSSFVCLLALSAHPLKAQDIHSYVWTHVPNPGFCHGNYDANADACFAFNQQWDAGRNQWINFWYRYDPDSETLRIVHSLYNNDPLDGDTVGFTANWTMNNGSAAFLFHQRWGINAAPQKGGNRRIEVFEFFVPLTSMENVVTLSMGFKQEQRRDDRILWSRVIEAGRIGCMAYGASPQSCSDAAGAAHEINNSSAIDAYVQPE